MLRVQLEWDMGNQVMVFTAIKEYCIVHVYTEDV